LRVIRQQQQGNTLTLLLEAPGGSTHSLLLHGPAAGNAQLRAEGASLRANQLTLTFPPGSGFIRQKVTLSW
jgi:hypothetical protein